MTSKRTSTMKDVAREAGVALGTVSKVINGIPVSEKNRIKVEEAIKALDYEVNTYARGLKTQKSNLVALIIPNTHNPFFATLTDHIEAALYRRKLKLLLCCTDGNPEKELEYLDMVMSNKVEGIIALTYSDIGEHIPSDFPLVIIDRIFENKSIPRVSSDNFAGGCLALEKLLAFGCRHPVYIRFHSIFPGESDRRKDGYLHACSKYHVEPDCLEAIDSEEALEFEIMKEFLHQHKNPDGTLTFDGVFAQTDYHAYMFRKLLLQDGFRVPEDVQIIGFDGVCKFGSEESGLYVSSICQPIEQMAEKCVEILVAHETEIVPSLTLLPVKYRYGGTTREEETPL